MPVFVPPPSNQAGGDADEEAGDAGLYEEPVRDDGRAEDANVYEEVEDAPPPPPPRPSRGELLEETPPAPPPRPSRSATTSRPSSEDVSRDMPVSPRSPGPDSPRRKSMLAFNFTGKKGH